MLEVIAIVISSLSLVISAILGWLEIRRDRKWLKVFCDVDVIGNSDELIEMVIIKAVNLGPHPVTIVRVGIRPKGDGDVNTLDELDSKVKQVPKQLGYGDHTNILIPTVIHEKQLEDRLNLAQVKRLQVYVRDAEDQEWVVAFPKYWKDQVIKKKEKQIRSGNPNQ